MQTGGQSVRPIVRHSARLSLFTILALAMSVSTSAQVYMHPPTTTTIHGHFLAPAPSVTSVGGSVGRGHMPPPAPSVTSIPNYGFKPNGAYHNGRYGHGYGYGYVGGWAYSIPYYYPADDSAYGYDYVGAGNPDLYSGPPLGQYDPSLHIVAEQPPLNAYTRNMPQPEAQVQPEPPARSLPDDKPGDPTTLIYRNGHHEEVNSYAIMGDSLYIFDQGRKKVALGDLDIAATVKANDDRGVEFRLPPSAKKKTVTTTAPPAAAPKSESTPSTATDTPPNVAAVMP
jgi:hypothetical protein